MWAKEYKKCISCGTTQKERRSSRTKIKEQLTPDVLKNLYLLKKMSLGDISRQHNCSRAYILKLCRLYNIFARDKFEARSLAIKRGKLFFDYHRVNERFFETWSKEMAYVLGLLYADGFMPKNKNSFSLSLKEKEFLEQIRGILESTHPIKKSKVQELYHLSIGSTKMVKDLLKLGLIPRKSLKIKFPDMPDIYVSHFIRGYFDGDGSLYNQKGRNVYQVDMVTGSKDFILTIKDKLEKLASVSTQKLHKHKESNSYYLKYQSRKDIERIFEYFYDKYTINNRLFFPRKFLKFQEAIDSYKNWALPQTRTSIGYNKRKPRFPEANEAFSRGLKKTPISISP